MADRSRSQSPARDGTKRPEKDRRSHPKERSGGFKWKEKKSNTDEDRTRRKRSRSPRRETETRKTSSVDDKFGVADKFGVEDKFGPSKKDSKDSMEDKPPAKAPAPAKQKVVASNEPMIIVTVNDRLGTKARIPCLASDSVKLFKAQVAARIGRQPHEIMLKRQSERPFKDQLTLEDYGVSNGVQLDLEIDTGE